MILKFLIRTIIIVMLIGFLIVIFPAWGMCCLRLFALFSGNALEAEPFKSINALVFLIIFPLAFYCMFAALLPSRGLRFSFITAAVLFVIGFSCALLPYSWKKEPLDPYYQTIWDQSKKTAGETSGYERIELDDNKSDQVILYVKAFGIRGGDYLFPLVCFIPCAAMGGEILLRKHVKNKVR